MEDSNKRKTVKDKELYCVKSVQIRSYFWSVFGHFSRRATAKKQQSSIAFYIGLAKTKENSRQYMNTF